MNIFEKAVKNKLRFKSNVGQITVEDLYDIPLNTLDSMYKELMNTLSNENSLLTTSEVDTVIQLKIDIIKYIVNYRLNEIEEKKMFFKKEDRKRTLERILEKKQHDELLDKSPDEIQKMIKELEME